MTVRLKLKRWPERYLEELRNYLTTIPHPGLQSAQALGREAVALRLETLELARIHESALMNMESSLGKNGLAKRAGKFFKEANSPIEKSHRAMRKTTIHLSRLKEKLDHRTEELAATNRQLQRVVVRRKVMEVALEKNGSHYKNCIEESLQLQKRLRQLTYRVLATQEDERQKISRELHDEIAQTLLGINVRLLSLKQEARKHSKGLKSDIATTQRLVLHSVRSVRRVAREINS